ncbi:MAG: hypothetical protein JXM79_06235 [Sedimentisphaerales bacterium]|nr:hypothetical protein [Sedimentisphaerales bacterium]
MAETAQDRLDALVARVKKVRRWLVTLAVLRVAALCLIFVSAYIGVYAWLDHRFNFGQTGRITALILLIFSLVLILHQLTKRLIRHISCSAAANYIENKQSFNQQLVTAIEYYENKQDYPYSNALAEQLVLQVERDSAEYRFDTAVQKWQGYVLGVIITFGLVVTWFYVKDNYVYFASYFARLIRPTASVEALSPTHLESITKDLVAEPDSEVNFSAEIEGHVPGSAKLVVVSLEPESEEIVEEQQSEYMKAEVKPATKSDQTARMEASRSFSKSGQYKYRFEAGSTSTPWHNLNISPAPDIERMTAHVTPPRKATSKEFAQPYTTQIENNTLEVPPGSNVTLQVQATDKLKKVIATDMNGKPMAQSLEGIDQFTYHFEADKNGSIRFDLVNEQGLPNNSIPGLDVVVKTDEPPKFELLSPDGDYLATDVASLPVTFEVTDDFGLESVELCLEIPGQAPAKLTIPIEEGMRSKTFTHTIELEEYNLRIGDSILFHARATDIDTGSTLKSRTASSEVYFIEIRPYRQNWRPQQGGPPSPNGMPAPEGLLNILEYTRAIVKKTWAIAEKSNVTDQDRSTLESIDNDVQYCAEQLAVIRDDSDYGWKEPHKAVFNTVIEYYKQASQHLTGYDASSALEPEKNAYRILRKFILELELELPPPPSGQSLQPEKPDSVKMQEKPPQYEQMEEERIESELQQLQKKLDTLKKEQENLKRSFKNILQQQTENEQSTPKTSDTTAGEQNEAKRKKDQQNQASSDQQGQQSSGEQSDNQSTAGSQSGSQEQPSSESPRVQQVPKGQVADPTEEHSDIQDQGKSERSNKEEDKNASNSQRPGQGKQNGENRDENPTESSSPSGIANTDLRLRMLQAKQRALQEQVSQLKRDLQQLPQTSQSNSEDRAQAQEHLDEALEKMDDFQDKLSESRYQSEMDLKQSSDALETMEAAKDQMDLAQEAIKNELTWNDDQRMADEARKMAEQLSADADAFDESVTEEEREDMLARLEAAKHLLETMPEPQWAQVGQGKRGQSSSVPVLTKNPNIDPAEAARQMARQFWSISLNAKKRRQQLIEDESSDVKFYEQENEFFENAAKFQAEPAQK